MGNAEIGETNGGRGKGRKTSGAQGIAARAIWLGSLVGAASPAFAQTVTEKAFLEELPVVLSASRIPQSLAATPGAVTVIDQKFIRATGYRDIPSLLKLVPGFQVATERGGYSHVTYHGLGNAYPNRMQVLIDGRSVFSPYHLGGVDWFSVPVTIDEIERIEVFRGSNSATYGSNAFLGVVNIITRGAGDRPGTDVGVAAGNNRLGDLTFNHERQQGDLGLRANVEIRYDEGLPVPVDTSRKGIVTLRADYRLGARDELSLALGVNDSRRGLGYAGTPNNANGLRSVRAGSAFAHLRWQRTLGPGEDFELGYYHNEDYARDEFNAHALPFFPVVPIDFNRKASRDNLDFQHRFSPGSNLRAVWGFELRRDTVQSRRVVFSPVKIPQELSRVFGNVEWQPLGALTLNAGAMVERFSGERSNVAPRLFANWQAVRGHTLRIGQSVAYRAKSVAEERLDMRFYSGGYSGLPLRISYVGYPDVLPERITAREVGYLGQFKTWDAALDVRVFRERITDFAQEILAFPPPPAQSVAFCRVPPAYVPPVLPLIPGGILSFCNSAVPLHNRGFEWHLAARPARGAQLKVGHSVLRTSAPFDRRHEREAPRQIVTASWLQEWSARWSSTLTAIHYGGYQWGSGSLPVDSYNAFDGRIAYRHGDLAKPMEFALVFQNLGSRHAEYLPVATMLQGNAVTRAVLLTAKFSH